MRTFSRNVKIAMGQLLVEGGEPERNLERAEELVEQAADRGCHLVLLPECLDLAWTHPSAKTEARPVPGPYSEELSRFARENGIWLCGGLTEKDGTRVYNTAVLMNDRGEIVLKYRKINELHVARDFYSVGRSLATVETPFGIVGVNICADNYVDGLAIGHTLARMGAELILSPSSWTVDYSITEDNDPYGEKWLKPYSRLATLYDLVIVGTTSVGMIVGGPYEGKKMVGCSLAVDRNGVVAKGDYNEFASDLIVADITVPERRERGTEISDLLRRRGYDFDAAL